jgi:threonylcarbamoyladenosine tRNA methylthiotransferase MtaB
MVGFPGEDDRAFGATMALVERLPFTYGHVFPYSNRPGTPAASLPGQVPAEVIRRRSEKLRSLLRLKRESFRHRHLGHWVEIVVEGVREVDVGRFHVVGTSEDYLPVRATGSGPAPVVRSRLPVRVTSIDEEYLAGEIGIASEAAASGAER